MMKTKYELPYDPKDPAGFFETMDEELLMEMVLYYPTHLKGLCMLLALDAQLYTEKLEKKPKRKTSKKKSYDNQGKI